MSVEEEIDPELNPILKYLKCESESYKNNLHKDRVFEVLQSSRNENDSFCDIKFQTDDGTIIYGHKNILASATPYFRAMFSSFGESNKDLVNIKELDSTIFLLLIDYIYTGEITITQENVQVMLAAADLLQLAYVKQACVEFLQKHLEPSNCLGIKLFADLHNCIELSSKCEEFIKNQFLEMVIYDEFLSLSHEEVIKLISCNNIAVPFEEKVYECVLKWVKHQLNKRKHLLPNLMEHVRLPLISKEYLLENVVNEHLLKNDPKCKDYVFEALHFKLIKSVNPSFNPETIRSTPRQLRKIVLVLSWSSLKFKCITSWYDPLTNQLQIASETEITNFHETSKLCLCVVKDQFVFIVDGLSKSVDMLDLSLQPHCWVHKIYLLSRVSFLKVCVLNDCIYAICCIDNRSVNTVVVFSLDTLEWQSVKSMSNKRNKFGVGVLNNLIYAVGGVNGSTYFKSVDCYDPIQDSWVLIAQMSISRHSVGVGVLNGLLYAIGGINKQYTLKSVEVYSPSDGVWTSIADMHLCRQNPGVVALDGLLYVIGGCSSNPADNSVEIYNPKTNSWSMKTISESYPIYGAVVVNRPPYL